MARFTGERRALAAAVMAFYAFIFFLVAMAPPPGWGACFAALSGVYGLGFFALVAGYFWARWFAIGVGISGAVSAAISMWQIGPEPVLVFWGATHISASLILWGNGMAKAFDGRAEWRARFHMDENATHKLGRAVIRAGISLPYVVMYALAPRQDSMTELVVIGGAGLAIAGIWGLIRMRTWGIAAMAGGAAVLVSTLSDSGYATAHGTGYTLDLTAVGLGAAMLLFAAVAPFVTPAARYVLKGE
jgi:hypothetical protein